MAKPRLPLNTRTTRTVRTTGGRKPPRFPANPFAHIAITPPAPIPLPYLHPGATASSATDRQIQASLGALPTQETVAAPYISQQAALGQLQESTLEHLRAAAAYRNDTARAIAQMTNQQGAAAAQSVGGASPEAAAAAPGDASTLGAYGTNAGAAVASEIGAIPGYTAQYQSRIANAMQQELDRVINQPRQQILAQRPSLYQTLLDRMLSANTQTEAQNQNAQTQGADLALRAAQLGISGYQAATARGTAAAGTQPTTTATTTQTTNPAQDVRDQQALVDKLTRFTESRADALFKQSSHTTTTQKPGYYVTYRYTTTDVGAPGTPPREVVHNGRVWVDEAHGNYLRQHAGSGVDLSSYLGLPKGSVRTGNLQPVGAGSTITTYSGQGYGDALNNLEHYIANLNAQFGLGYSEEAIHALALNAVNARWAPGARGRPARPPARGGNAGPPPGYPRGHTYPTP
jgi:hypothetical protein